LESVDPYPCQRAMMVPESDIIGAKWRWIGDIILK
jgi:hypothetical protein